MNVRDVTVEHAGRQVTLAELAGITRIHSKTLASRYQKGKRGADLIAPPLRGGLAALTPQQIARLEEAIRLRRRNTAKAVAAELGLTRRAVNHLRMDLTRKMAKEGRL